MIDREKLLEKRVYNLSSGEEVVVGLFYPQRGAGDWFCRHFIQWGGDAEVIKQAPGIDALDALLRSVEMVRVQLEAKAEWKGLSLSWEGNPDLGLRS